MTIRRISAVFIAIISCWLLAVPAPATDGTRQSFPLSEGTYWIYRGFVRSWVKGSAGGKVTHVTWKMSVVRAVHRDNLDVVVISGFPTALDWSGGDAKPELSIMIRTQDGKFYLNSSLDTDLIISRLDDPQYSLQALVRDYDWFLQLPLSQGEKFCEPEGRKRSDGRYCWVVGPPHPAALAGVRGLAPGKRIAYEIKYTTTPDDTEFDFVPGVGITSYGFHHHGTTADTELHLAEFHPPKN